MREKNAFTAAMQRRISAKRETELGASVSVKDGGLKILPVLLGDFVRLRLPSFTFHFLPQFRPSKPQLAFVNPELPCFWSSGISLATSPATFPWDTEWTSADPAGHPVDDPTLTA